MDGRNRLLQALSPQARKQVLDRARSVVLPRGYMFHHASEDTTDLYFLTRGVASFVVTLRGGESAEIGMVGNEGLVGSTCLLGSYAPCAHCVMQMAGAGYRLPLDEMKRLFQDSAEVRGLVLQATQQHLLTIRQISACNRLHNATERLARWLLTAADRAENDRVFLTQEKVAQMLGTRRTTVALVAGTLQRSGLIHYRRGKVSIVDRVGLTAVACDCYVITRQMVECLYKDALARHLPS